MSFAVRHPKWSACSAAVVGLGLLLGAAGCASSSASEPAGSQLTAAELAAAAHHDADEHAAVVARALADARTFQGAQAGAEQDAQAASAAKAEADAAAKARAEEVQRQSQLQAELRAAEAKKAEAAAKVQAQAAEAQDAAAKAAAAKPAEAKAAEAQAAGTKAGDASAAAGQPDDFSKLVAEIQTSKGALVLAFRADKAPGHVQNFVSLARKGFYDGLTFHRIIPGFMIQGGDPKGDGSGGPGYQIKAEFNDLAHVRGVLSMARGGHPDSAGSQFFICHATADHLDGKYTAFGMLVKGWETLDAIAAEGSPGGVPRETISITKVTIRAAQSDETL